MATTTTEVREKFCQLVFQGKAHIDAYVETHPACKSRANANDSAKRMMKGQWVQKRLAELRQLAETAAVMQRQEILERLSEIGRARLSDFVEADSDGAHIKVGLESAHSAALQEVITETVNIGGRDTKAVNRITKLKLRDPIPAIDMINKLRGDYAPEKHEVAYSWAELAKLANEKPDAG
jgi:hypothetical protein